MKHQRYIKEHEVQDYLSPAGPNCAFKLYKAVHKKSRQRASIFVCDKAALEKELPQSAVQRIFKQAGDFKPSDEVIDVAQALIYICNEDFAAALPFLPERYRGEEAILFGLNSLQTKDYTDENEILVKADGTYVEFGTAIENELFQIYNAAINAQQCLEKDWIAKVKENLSNELDVPQCIFSLPVKEFILSGKYSLEKLYALGQNVNFATAATQTAQEFLEYVLNKDVKIDAKILLNYVAGKFSALFSQPQNHEFLIELLTMRYRALISDSELQCIFEPIVVACTYSSFELKAKKLEAFRIYTEGITPKDCAPIRYSNPFIEFAAGAKIKDENTFSPNADAFLASRDLNFWQNAEINLMRAMDVLLSADVSCKGHQQACMLLFTCLNSYAQDVVIAALKAAKSCLELFSLEHFMDQPFYEYKVDFSKPYTNFLVPTLMKVAGATESTLVMYETVRVLDELSDFLSDNDVVEVLFKTMASNVEAFTKYEKAAMQFMALLARLSKRLGYSFACGKALGVAGILLAAWEDRELLRSFAVIKQVILQEEDAKQAGGDNKEPIVDEESEDKKADAADSNLSAERPEIEEEEHEVEPEEETPVAAETLCQDEGELQPSAGADDLPTEIPEAEQNAEFDEQNAIEEEAQPAAGTGVFDPFEEQATIPAPQMATSFDPFAELPTEREQEVEQMEPQTQPEIEQVPEIAPQQAEAFGYQGDFEEPEYEYNQEYQYAEDPYQEELQYYPEQYQEAEVQMPEQVNVQEEDPYMAQFDITQDKINNFDPFSDE